MVSPFRDLSLSTQALAKELKINIEVVEGGLEYALQAINQRTGPEVDVFISRGGTADLIARNYEIPVIGLNTSLYDIIECCEEARRYSRNIAVTSFSKPFVGVHLLEKAMDVSITEIIFHDRIALEEQIETLALEGNYCVVGGGPSIQAAQRAGLHSVFLRAGRETIREALLRAAEVAQLRREEKRKAYRFKAILDSAYDGIISIDHAGKIEIFNPAAERLVGIEASKAIGEHVDKIVPNSKLAEVMRTGQPKVGEFQDLGNVRIVTNRVPFRDDKEVMGAVATFQDVSRVIQVEHRLRQEMTKACFKAKYRLEDVIGQSEIMEQLKDIARSFANSDLTVFIYGPSGSGKEMFAQGIHNASKRVFGPFVAINCAALPPGLLESELFGYDEGAFTGAKRKGKLGLFELAHGGTVFLDEIDALPIELQGRLLRVLQEKEVLRVGGEAIIPVNIRVIAATNQSPHELISTNKLREDLYYRLNVLYLELPQLKERKSDIPLLCHHFLPTVKFEQISGVLIEMMPFLCNYSWPGNIRELQNFCQRLSFYQENYLLNKDVQQLLKQIAPTIITEQIDKRDKGDLASRVQVYETEIIEAAVKETGSMRKAAEKLGIGKSTVSRKLKQVP
jgi:PAS domain S-box-containing protein